MKSPVLVPFLFLVVLVAALAGLEGYGEAKTDIEVMQDSATGPGGGGDGDGLPFEEQIEDVADAVADAVNCVVDAFENIIQDARDLVSDLWNLDKTIVELITQAAKSVADLYLEYQTFLFQTVENAAGNVRDAFEEARRIRDQALSTYSAQGATTDGQEGNSGSTFNGNLHPTLAQPQARPAAMATPSQEGTETVDMATEEEILEALNLGMERVGEMEREVLLVIKAGLTRTVEETIGKIQAKVEAAVALAEEVLLTPIRVWLQVLRNFIDNPCDFLNPVGTAGDIMNEVNANLEKMIDPIRALRNDVPGAFADAETLAEEAEDRAAAAEAIIQNMRNLLDRKDRSALVALNGAIASSRSVLRAAGQRLEILKYVEEKESSAGLERATTDAIRYTQSIRNKVGNMENRMEGSVRAVLAARQKLSTDLDRMFKGRPAPEAEVLKTSILTRIRSKHPGNTRLLSDAKSFLDREVTARVSTSGVGQPLTGVSTPASIPLSASSGDNRSSGPFTRPVPTQERPGISRPSPFNRPGSRLDPSPSRATAPPSPVRTMGPRPSPAAQLAPTPPPATGLRPVPAGDVPAVSSMTQLRLPLVRGGVAQELTITGTGLDRVKVQIVKGGRVVSDVTATIRSVSSGSLKVTLTAPSIYSGSGDDYYLRVLSGIKVISQKRFTVQVPAVQAPARPAMRPAPSLTR